MLGYKTGYRGNSSVPGIWVQRLWLPWGATPNTHVSNYYKIRLEVLLEVYLWLIGKVRDGSVRPFLAKSLGELRLGKID
jgi:hypothetical protein